MSAGRGAPAQRTGSHLTGRGGVIEDGGVLPCPRMQSEAEPTICMHVHGLQGAPNQHPRTNPFRRLISQKVTLSRAVRNLTCIGPVPPLHGRSKVARCTLRSSPSHLYWSSTPMHIGPMCRMRPPSPPFPSYSLTCIGPVPPCRARRVFWGPAPAAPAVSVEKSAWGGGAWCFSQFQVTVESEAGTSTDFHEAPPLQPPPH